MINIFNILENCSKITPLSELKIYSRLRGYIMVELNYANNKIIDVEGKIAYDSYGRVFESGESLLFPDNKYLDWNIFLKTIVLSEHDKELKLGEVCLVKTSYSSPWCLAIYNGKKEDQTYKARLGKEEEIFPYCISFSHNKEYLGRESFPSWLICDEEFDI